MLPSYIFGFNTKKSDNIQDINMANQAFIVLV